MDAILSAIAEYNALGELTFLRRYRYGKAKAYFLIHEGKSYPSKAILGVANKYTRQGTPLSRTDFSGGDATVKRKLESLGFIVEVRSAAPPQMSAALSSELLTPGEVYSREDLKSQFKITDATINTGVFRPKGFNSVWLFITEEKTADRTQYHDLYDEGVLTWQGQSSSRTDGLIIGHRDQALEILVFYRKRKYEFPGAAFRYLGPFNYVSHVGSKPTTFTLHPAPIDDDALLSPHEAIADDYGPIDLTDARNQALRSVVLRRGQKAFRDQLVRAFGGRCAISGCEVLDVLEAAHIVPYLGPATNQVTNGLLVRADLHTLFDCGLIDVDPNSLTITVTPRLRASEYGPLHGQPLNLPAGIPAEVYSQSFLARNSLSASS